MSDAAARIRALTEAATSAPWTISQQFPRGVDARGEAVVTTERVGKGVADAALIVALRNAAGEIADLIQAVETLVVTTLVMDRRVVTQEALTNVADALAAVEARLGEPA